MNQDGFICRIELTQLFLRNGYSQEEVNAIMIASDENNDGKICIEEFKRNFEFF
jgi:Ca2+-binding EF-hand superfamily protein